MRLTLSYKISRDIDAALIILLAFFAGAYNSRQYMPLLRIPAFENIFVIFLLLLILLNLWWISAEILLRKRTKYENRRYWLPILIVIVSKNLLFLLQDYSMFREFHLGSFSRFMMDISLMAIFSLRISNWKKLEYSVMFFGIGCAIAPLIGFLFFPHMIASRSQWVGGNFFNGGFWNSSVIGFIASAWLLIALGNIKQRKHLSIILALLMCLGGLAGLSRAILLSTIVSTSWYVMKNRNIKTSLLAFFTVMIFLVVAFSLFGDLTSSLLARLNIAGIGNEARLIIWKGYINKIEEFFLWGAPIQGHRIYSPTGHDPHSVLLNWLSQYGILGLVSFLWLIWGLLKSAKIASMNINESSGNALLTWIIAYLSLAIINETGFVEPSFYAAMGIILAWGNIGYIQKTDTESKKCHV